MRDHGGNLDWAMRQFGGGETDWVDLSTGINPVPYPVGTIDGRSWAALPTRADLDELIGAAQDAYGATCAVLPVAGATAGIQMLPWIRPPGEVCVVGPTYNEHAASFRAAGWQVRDVVELDKIVKADAAVVVNPNNPTGQTWSPQALRNLARRVELLVVDESFVDTMPEVSLVAPGQADLPENTIVLRSFGKFYGLAGVRLGFALGSAELIRRLAEQAGPWPVSGPAIEIGARAMRDSAWYAKTLARLAADATRLDQLAEMQGLRLVGGTQLFRLYDTANAVDVQAVLATNRVWSRVFPYSQSWLRLGLPAPLDWAHVEVAFAGLDHSV